MTPSAHLTALARYGYTGPSATFLVQVLQHTGVFLRRQYLSACGVESGGADNRFLSRLLASRHAQRRPYYARELAYHVTSRTLYAAVGQPHSRLRRLPHDILRAQRLMTLDFLLEHRDDQYLASEEERVHLFTGPYGVAREHLPQQRYAASAPGGGETVRFFVERFPVFLKAGTSTVFFVFPQVTYSAAPLAFGTFLARYADLLSRLPASEIVYLHAQDVDPMPAARLFRQFIAPPRVVFVARVDRYFAARTRLAQPPGLTTPERHQYERDRARFRDVPDLWYTRWLADGRAALHDLASTLGDESPFPNLHFRLAAMPYVYAYHGTQPSAGRRRERGDRKSTTRSTRGARPFG